MRWYPPSERAPLIRGARLDRRRRAANKGQPPTPQFQLAIVVTFMKSFHPPVTAWPEGYFAQIW